MKLGTRVVATFPEDAELEPAIGTIIEIRDIPGKGLVLKVKHDEGWDNWFPEKWVKPLLRLV
jgi:hypothetical protein